MALPVQPFDQTTFVQSPLLLGEFRRHEPVSVFTLDVENADAAAPAHPEGKGGDFRLSKTAAGRSVLYHKSKGRWVKLTGGPTGYYMVQIGFLNGVLQPTPTREEQLGLEVTSGHTYVSYFC